MAAKPWEQGPDESPQAFEAFQRYLAQDPAKRSARLVGEELGKSTGLLERWCADKQWVSRARQWDAEAQRLAMVAEQKRAVVRAKNMQIRHRKLGRSALEMAMTML